MKTAKYAGPLTKKKRHKKVVLSRNNYIKLQRLDLDKTLDEFFKKGRKI